MTITPFRCVEVFSQENNLRYQWDDWNVEQADSPIDKSLQARLDNLSYRSLIGYYLVSGEWIVSRLRPFLANSLPYEYLEAGWVMSIDWRYGDDWELLEADSEWTGPVKGPVREAMKWISFSIQQSDEGGNVAWGAAHITKLTEYILPSHSAYVQWRERILPRLETLYPRDSHDRLGDVVPREAYDPEVDFKVDEGAFLVSQFLGRMQNTPNRFLNSSEEMRRNGFAGTPFVFNIDQDRRLRKKF